MIKAKAPSPRILKNGFMKGFKILPNMVTIFVCINNSVATKKGKREGTTELAQSCSPDFTAGKLLFEKMSKQKVKDKNNRGRMFFLSFIT